MHVQPKLVVIYSHCKVNTLQWNLTSSWVLTEGLRCTWFYWFSIHCIYVTKQWLKILSDRIEITCVKHVKPKPLVANILIPQSPTPTPYTLPPSLELQTYNTNVIKSTDYFSLLPSCIFGYCDKSCLFRGSVININLKTTVINIRSLNE